MKKLIIGFFIVVVSVIIVLFVNLMIFINEAQEISTGVQIEKYSENKSALLVIDIQEATTGKFGTSECYTNNSDYYIKLLNQAIKASYNSDIPIIYIKNETDNFLINLINNSLEKGGRGCQFDDRLYVISDLIISKEKNDSFSNPKLDSILTTLNISHLYISGLDAAFCVNNTIQAANSRGYELTVIDELLLSESDTLKTQMMDSYKNINVSVISLEEFHQTLTETPDI